MGGNCSFRGAKFWDKSDSLPLGRKVVTTEFPFRDDAETDDFGNKAHRFTINGYCLGKDWISDRDALIAALEKKGPGELIHPKYGAINATFISGEVAHDGDRNGMATFSMEFIEEGTQKSFVKPDTQIAATNAATNAADTAKETLIDNHSVTNNPEWVLTKTTQTLDSAIAKMDEIKGKFTAQTENISAYVQKASKVTSRLTTLARQPLLMATDVSDLISSFADLIQSPNEALSMLRVLSGFLKPSKTASDASSAAAQANTNTNAIIGLVAAQALNEAVKITSNWDFETYDDAMAARTVLNDWISDLSLNAANIGDYDAFDAIEGVRIAIIRDIDTRGAALPRTVKIRPKSVLPAIVIAYQNYGLEGLESRYEDLIIRNKIANPLFVFETELAVLNG